MKPALFASNTPSRFWRLEFEPEDAVWNAAVETAAPVLGIDFVPGDYEKLLNDVLGEGRFGKDHWDLGVSKRLYYTLKPLLPRALSRAFRRIRHVYSKSIFDMGWPIEDRYVRFMKQVLAEIMKSIGSDEFSFVHFWPEGFRYALVLTHDIETSEGQTYAREIADIEDSLGFRSSFNFVAERYRVDQDLIRSLREDGFEVGLHGLRHDGKLFASRREFVRRAERINSYLKEFDAVGFRAPFNLREPEWMQALEVNYDLSFFDTDPFEPISGGTMSIWPFEIGRFVELPATLVQDYSLTKILGESSPDLWLRKLEFIRENCGMALLNTHPDYLRDASVRRIYIQFLEEMSSRGDYWQALPREVASWWRARADSWPETKPSGAVRGIARLDHGTLVLDREESFAHTLQ